MSMNLTLALVRDDLPALFCQQEHESCEFGRKGEAGGDPEENGEEVSEMAHESTEERVAIRLDENIRSVSSQSPLSLIERQTPVAGFQPLQHIFDRKLVNVVMAELTHGHPARSARSREHVSASFQTRCQGGAARSWSNHERR